MDELKKAIEKVIELLPDWAKDRRLMLISGKELVFRYDGQLLIKLERCNNCAACCLEIPDGHTGFKTNGEGRCEMLADDGKCNAGQKTPLVCLDDPPLSDLKDLGCYIEYYLDD